MLNHELRRRSLFNPGLLLGLGAGLAGTEALQAQNQSAADEPSLIGIMQICFVVPNLREAIADWAERLGVGPWSITEHFRPRDPIYRGQPSTADVAIGMSYSGPMNVELIQPLDDAPSVYRDWIAKHGHGFHHWGVGTRDFARDVERYRSRGDVIAFSSSAPRLVYIETKSTLPGFVELIEVNDGVRASFGNMYRRSRDWDGKNPIVAQ